MLAHVPQLDVQQANLQTIDIGQVALGPITVGDLVLSNTDFSLNSGHGVARNMNVHLTLTFSLEWWIGIHKIIHIDIHRTTSLGSVELNMPQVDVAIKALANIHIAIPQLTGQTTTVQADPLELKLQNASADHIQAKNVALPSAGFTIAGLSLNSVQGNNVSVPAANLDQATVDRLHGEAITIPSFNLRNLNLSSARTDSVVNTAPLDIPLDMKLSHEPGFDAGILKVILHITVSADAHIPYLELNDVSASATVGQIALHNVSIPYDVHNLTLSQVGITTIGVPAFSVS